MSYQERRALVALMSTLLITVVYSGVMLQHYPQAEPYSPEVFHFWGSFFLMLVPVSIVAKIVVAIMFAIGNAVATRIVEPSITDERDRLIDLKAGRNAMVVFALGFLLAMASLVFSQPPVVMFVILVGAGLLADVISEISQFYFYRRGY